MNSNLINRMLKTEAENLYNHNTSPENFLKRIQPLINALELENNSEVMSANDLETILVASKSKKKKYTKNQDSFFDVVDLCMYRSN